MRPETAPTDPLGDEGRRSACREPAAISACGTARGEDHERRIRAVEKRFGDREPVDVGKLDIEEHHVWRAARGGCQRFVTGAGLSDDLKAGRVQQRPRRAAKLGVVVDYQNAD